MSYNLRSLIYGALSKCDIYWIFMYVYDEFFYVRLASDAVLGKYDELLHCFTSVVSSYSFSKHYSRLDNLK